MSAPRRDGPDRLFSLWDLMKAFNVFRCAANAGRLEYLQTALEDSVKKHGGGTAASPERIASIRKVLKDEIEPYCTDIGFNRCAKDASLADHYLGLYPESDFSTVLAELRHVSDALFLELEDRHFFEVDGDLIKGMNNDALFGPLVAAAFPSTAADLREAGNCMAAECTTAAVFHLMRAAEVALRVLAKDRDVTYPNAQLESKMVGDLIVALDAKVKKLRDSPASRWPSTSVRDGQIKFYAEAMVEFRAFNEAWRKHMAHAHEGAFYDADHATSIATHVRRCLQNLAKKVSEDAVTPEYWVSL